MIVANATGCSSIYGGNLPTTPWTAERRRPRAGMEQLAVRGQRRVRAGHAPRARSRSRRTPGCSCSGSAGSRRRPGQRSSMPPAERGGDRAQRERIARLQDELRRPGRRPRQRTLGTCSRSPTTLVRKGVWIIGGDGWAYDIGFGGARPRPGVGAQREHPGARHRGVLEHRRTGIEGHPARRGRQVRGGGQGHRQEGPGRDRPGLRQRLCGPDRDGRQRPPDHQGPARSRRLARTVARHRLLRPASPMASTCRRR